MEAFLQLNGYEIVATVMAAPGRSCHEGCASGSTEARVQGTDASRQEFAEFVLRATLVRENAAPYAVHWVRRFPQAAAWQGSLGELRLRKRTRLVLGVPHLHPRHRSSHRHRARASSERVGCEERRQTGRAAHDDLQARPRRLADGRMFIGTEAIEAWSRCAISLRGPGRTAEDLAPRESRKGNLPTGPSAARESGARGGVRRDRTRHHGVRPAADALRRAPPGAMRGLG